MKNPNKYGGVFKLSGNRRKPWAVRITTGWSANYKQQYKYLSYHATRVEAVRALADYNTNPYQLETANITFSEIYDKWSSTKFNKIGQSAINTHRAAYKTCEPIHDMKFAEPLTKHYRYLWYLSTTIKKHKHFRLFSITKKPRKPSFSGI